MDPFAVIMLGGTAGAVGALYLLGVFYPGDGRQQLKWQPTRTPEDEARNDIDDLEQMLAAANARRRKRGKPEHTEESLAHELAGETRAALKRSDDYVADHVADEEITQMLEAKNKRRSRKGLAELTPEEYRESLRAPRGGT